MKNRLLVTGILTMLCGAAQAQTNVSLYGFLYSGIRHVDDVGGKTLTGLATGPSRWGLRGKEDLGDGMSAVMTLESGFDMGSGRSMQGSRLFGRQAYVGLESKSMGTLTMGRQYDFVASYIAPFTPPGKWNGYMSHIGDNDNTNFQFRLNNSVKYVTPTINGFEAGALYSFGEVAGDTQRNSGVSAGLKYGNGPLKVAAGYFRVNNPAAAVAEGNWNSILFPAVSATSSTAGAPIAPNRMTVYGLGGQYDFSKAKVAVAYTQSRFEDLNAPALGLTTADARYRNFDVNMTYPIFSSAELGLGYTQTRGDVNETGFQPKYHQVNALVNYFLSKRTILQGAVTYMRAGGDAPNSYVLFGSNGPSSGRSQTMVLAGIFHFF